MGVQLHRIVFNNQRRERPLGDLTDYKDKYGRRAMRSELQHKIMSGVMAQREKMKEDEILVKMGEKQAQKEVHKKVDTTQRDRMIGSWLNKRRNSVNVRAPHNHAEKITRPSQRNHRQPRDATLPNIGGGMRKSQSHS